MEHGDERCIGGVTMSEPKPEFKYPEPNDWEVQSSNGMTTNEGSAEWRVVPWVHDSELEAKLNALYPMGYDVVSMFRNSPDGGGNESTTVVARKP